MYVVTGATGHTGRVVAETLLAAGVDVLAIGRSEERLRPLVEKGAQAFVGSAEDAQTMSIAFSGAVGAYCMIPPRYSAPDPRAHQRTIGESLASAVHEAGVQHVVLLSSLGAQHTSGTGPVVGLREQEIRLAKLKDVNVLSLRPGYFMENFYASIGMIRAVGAVGTPMIGDVPVPMIAARDIGQYAARRLLELDFEGASTRELLGPRDVTLQEATDVIGAAIGQSALLYKRLSSEEFEAAALQMGMSKGAIASFLEMYGAMSEGRLAPEEERSTENTTPTTIEEFAESFAAVYAGSGK
jgi:uncharacterized protein YbjT (DUF2867 family)